MAVVNPVIAVSASVTAQSHCPAAAAKFLVNVTVSVCVAPSESLTATVATCVAPSDAEKSRLPLNFAFELVAAGTTCPMLIWIGPAAPTTFNPVASTRLPLASVLNAPARVYTRSVPSVSTKKPSPWMAMSLLRLVGWIEPCSKFPLMLLTFIPRPICMGFVPPADADALPALSVWPRMSSKITSEALNPVVFALAMLLPITSSHSWWFRRPDTAVNIARDMNAPLSSSPC